MLFQQIIFGGHRQGPRGETTKMRPDELILTERRTTETMSVSSEGTTTTSISGKSCYENREEIRDIANRLGIDNPDDLLQDRFRVDRRKLEHMLQGQNNYINIQLLITTNVSLEIIINVNHPYRSNAKQWLSLLLL